MLGGGGRCGGVVIGVVRDSMGVWTINKMEEINQIF